MFLNTVDVRKKCVLLFETNNVASIATAKNKSLIYFLAFYVFPWF